jgi:sporulation protein YlmC with PRC-barrel domain
MSGNRMYVAVISALCLGAVSTVWATDSNRMQRSESAKNLVFTRNIIGQPVRNNAGQEIGHVDDLILNPDGQVQYGILSVGKGFLGIGNKRVTIPWQDLVLSTTDEGYQLNVTKQALLEAPAYETGQMPSSQNGEYQPMSQEAQTYQGKVVSIDQDAHTITVRQSMIGHDFRLGNSVQAGNVKVGDQVKVTYTNENGQKLAQSVEDISQNQPSENPQGPKPGNY